MTRYVPPAQHVLFSPVPSCQKGDPEGRQKNSHQPIRWENAMKKTLEIAKVPRALAQQTRDEFFPKQALQLSEVKGLDVTLKQALEFKYITTPMTAAEAQGMLDILYKPNQK
jgi:hypothetical protein